MAAAAAAAPFCHRPNCWLDARSDSSTAFLLQFTWLIASLLTLAVPQSSAQKTGPDLCSTVSTCKNNNSAQAAQAAIIDTSNTHMQLAGLKAPLETHCHTTLPLLALQLSDAAFLCSSQNYCCHLLRYFTSSARYITRDTNTSTCIRETAVCSYLA